MTYRTLQSIGLWSGALLFAASCGVAEGQEDSDQAGQIEEGLTTVMSDDFESYQDGSIGAPWSLEIDGGQVVTESTSDHGNVLLLQGNLEEASYVAANLEFSAPTDVTASFDINPDADASFMWILHGAGDGIGSRRIRLQRAPGSSTLVANTAPSGDVSCGSLPSGVWSTVTLVLHPEEGPPTFDVLIDGNPTDCSGVQSGLEAPIDMVSLADASNAGWGGDVRLDNLLITTP